MRLIPRVVRPGEGRDTAGAFFTLFGLMTGHALLETARDALFLAKISPVRLPLVYLAIAGLAVAISATARAGRRPARSSLGIWIAGGAAVTLGFWALTATAGDWSLYALYVWSGLLSTLLVVRFWLLAGDLFTVSQAKRLFALIGTGSILGAVAGSAAAQAIALELEPRQMLLAAAAALFATAAAPGLMRRAPEDPAAAGAAAGGQSPGGAGSAAGSAGAGGGVAPSRRDLREDGLFSTLRLIRGHAYVRRMALLVLVSTVALTFADLVFKATVATSVSHDQLAWVFAFIYMVVNILSLIVQLVFVGWATRNLSIDRVLAFLPALLLIGSGWFLAGGGLLAAMALKGVDGTLRHSLHRTASEVLSLPLPAELRKRLKAFIDVVGQRGGQALASLAFLALAELGMVGAMGG
ncbi:MAG TPA: Npt1/Npt2 family nucleotide transporter, partial [bacterium]|nr:Npt1/Npt2 family nucleotide transporter [bacterium]